MAETFELKNPIEIDGAERRSFDYDPELISVAQFAAAEAAAKKNFGKVVSISEFDYTFHFYLGAYSIIAVDPRIDITDLERIKGSDILRLGKVGRFFTMQSDESEESSSDEPSDSSHESSAPQSPTSTELPSSSSSMSTARP